MSILRFLAILMCCVFVAALAVDAIPRVHHVEHIDQANSSPAHMSVPANMPGIDFVQVESRLGFTVNLPYSARRQGIPRYKAYPIQRGHHPIGRSMPDGRLAFLAMYQSGVSWLDYGTRGIYCDELDYGCPSTAYEDYSLTILTGNSYNLEQALYEKPVCASGQYQGMWHFTFQGYPAMFQRCVPGNATGEQREYDMLVVVRGSYCFRLVAWGFNQPPVFARRFLDSFRLQRISPGAKLMPAIGRVSI